MRFIERRTDEQIVLADRETILPPRLHIDDARDEELSALPNDHPSGSIISVQPRLCAPRSIAA